MENGFSGRLALVRKALTDGPVGSLVELAKVAEVSENMLWASYRSQISDDARRQIAQGTAALLDQDPALMEAWLVDGVAAPDLEAYLSWLPTQVACTACDDWLPPDDENWVAPLRRCRPCVNQLSREKRNPAAARFEEALTQKLPEIRAVHPKLGTAIEDTIRNRQAVTYARLSQRAAITVAQVAAVLKSYGLDKRAMVVLALVMGALSSACEIAHEDPLSSTATATRRVVRNRSKGRRSRRRLGIRLWLPSHSDLPNEGLGEAA